MARALNLNVRVTRPLSDFLAAPVGDDGAEESVDERLHQPDRFRDDTGWSPIIRVDVSGLVDLKPQHGQTMNSVFLPEAVS